MSDACIACGKPGARYAVVCTGDTLVGEVEQPSHPDCIPESRRIAIRAYAETVVMIERELRIMAEEDGASLELAKGDTTVTGRYHSTCGCRVLRDGAGSVRGLVRAYPCKRSLLEHWET